MKFVNMNEVAFDPDTIIFPGLGNCHGVVYQTNVGLFGFHIYGADKSTANKAIFFADFLKWHQKGNSATGQKLYGVCPSNRYFTGALASQQAELKVVAKALGFTGPIEGAMWDTAKLGWSTTYTDCTLVDGKLNVAIQDFTGQNGTLGPCNAGLDHKAISVVAPLSFGGPQPMTHGSLKTPAEVIVTAERKSTPASAIQTAAF